jgi:hypothetical protein
MHTEKTFPGLKSTAKAKKEMRERKGETSNCMPAQKVISNKNMKVGHHHGPPDLTGSVPTPN